MTGNDVVDGKSEARGKRREHWRMRKERKMCSEKMRMVRRQCRKLKRKVGRKGFEWN